MAEMGSVVIRPGREKKIRSRYPWVQREEVCAVEGPVEPGGLAHLRSTKGEFLAVGTFNPSSRFPFRVLSLEPGPIDEAFFRARFEAARDLRAAVVKDADGCRFLFSEADGVPGLIADQYGGVLIVQVRTLGMEKLKNVWLNPLIQVSGAQCVFEKSDMPGRKEERLENQVGPLFGTLPERIETHESGLVFEVDVLRGLKTGFYFDHRENRRKLAREITPGERVADLFCYSGAFALYAARAGAETVGVDINAQAIQTASRNAQKNGMNLEFVCANAFEWLEQAAADNKVFDRIILDPPAIAKSRGERNSLKWAIWKLTYLSAPVLRTGGRLLVCNCSYQLSLVETLETIRLAASDRGRKAFLQDVSFQAPDHPALLQFPESLYLKCAWVRLE